MESSHAVESVGGYCSTLLTSKVVCWGTLHLVYGDFQTQSIGDRVWALSVQGGGGDDRPNEQSCPDFNYL
jgi:hypothetical protein